MVVDKVADHIDRPVGEAMRAGLEHPVGFQKATVIDHSTGRILCRELYPRLVKVANLWNQRVANVLVLNHNIGLHRLVRLERERSGAQRRDHLPVIHRLQRKDVDVEEVTALEEVDRLGELLIKAVIERNRRVASEPAMRSQLAILGAVVGQGDWGRLHVAVLAGSEVRVVESQRVALRKLRPLPFVIRRKCTNPLIAIKRRRQVRLMARRAKLRRLVDVLHHGLGVPVQIRHYLGVGHDARDAVALFIHHHRWYSHHEAPITELGLHALNGMAGRAGQTVAIERPVNRSVRIQSSCQNGDWVMAAVAMPRELDPLRPHNDVHAGAIERRPEGIGMQRLAPLVVRLLMAVAAVSRIGKGAGLEKVATNGRGIARHRKLVFAKRETIGLSNLVSIGLANARLFSDLVLGPMNGFETQHGNSGQYNEENEHAPGKVRHKRKDERNPGPPRKYRVLKEIYFQEATVSFP